MPALSLLVVRIPEKSGELIYKWNSITSGNRSQAHIRPCQVNNVQTKFSGQCICSDDLVPV